MHLLEELAAGIEDAASGYVEVKSRGTTTNASVYSDPEGTNERTGTLTLGSNGELECYVNEQVDVYVYTSAGVLIRGPWTSISRAETAIYKGQSFTGTDPVSGATGANKDAKLSDVLDEWKDSAGGIDFKAQSDVASTPATKQIKQMSVGWFMSFYCVTAPEYGAKADGTTDDTTAIQAAIDAAEAAGGGVVLLPPGTYLISSALVIDSAGVTIQGLGHPKINTTSTSINIFTVTGANTTLENLRIDLASSVGADSSGIAVSVSAADNFRAKHVWVSTVFNTYVFDMAIKVVNTTNVYIETCRGEGDTTGLHVEGTYPVSDSHVYISNCRFLGSNGTTGYGIDLDDMSNIHITATTIGGTGTGHAMRFVDCAIVDIVGLNLSGSVATVSVDAGTTELSAVNADVTWSMANDASGDNAIVAAGANLHGGDIASASPLVLTNPGVHRHYTVTGTTGFSTIDNATSFPEGFEFSLDFTGALTVTDGSGNIDLDNGANFSTANGDSLTLRRQNGRFKEIGRTNT